MLVTLMTDASLCHKTGAAGFGYWCASDRGKRAGGNIIKGVVKDSYEAEFKGVANSLQASINAGLISKGDEVLIQVDNEGVLFCLSGKCKVRPDIAVVLNHILDTAKMYELKLRCRQVKGHTKLTDNRYLANHHCDSRAKYAMRQARKVLKKSIAEKVMSNEAD
ncbi:hypothetical protein LLH94_000788 [Acinetobacter baumannii]|nr:hypothetical protein [Acinetobacter baumannii]EKU7956437.1 hypothetical protein [Acinetobacter baumannii]EKV2862298.1 hypothetical protein [Acinetobacter baumannii]